MFVYIEHSEDFWLYRWAHAIDGTSDQPFILELFATSQPDVFERIHPSINFSIMLINIFIIIINNNKIII